MEHSDLHQLEALTALTLPPFGVNMSSRILCAVSGGADSIALGRILSVIQKTGQFRALSIVHINHSLRGDESNADEAFVKEFSKTIGAELHIVRVDTASCASQKGVAIEEAARELRYQEFIRIASEKKYEFVATAHTANDNLETVLHNLIRGTGLSGLRGVPPKRKLNNDADVIRPLLDIERADILKYLETNQTAYRTDASNLSHEFLRNRLRRLVVPQLEQAFEGRNIYDGFRRTIRIVNDYVERHTESIERLVTFGEMKLPQYYLKRDVHGYFVAELYQLDTNAMRSFIMAVIRNKWNDKQHFSLDSTQTMLLRNFMKDMSKTELWLASDIVIRLESVVGNPEWLYEDMDENQQGFNIFTSPLLPPSEGDDEEDPAQEKLDFEGIFDIDEDDDDDEEEGFAYELLLIERVRQREKLLVTELTPGTTINIRFGKLSAELIRKDEVGFEQGNAYLDWEIVKDLTFVLRYWEEGDKIAPFGMEGRSKLVSDILNEAGVPSYLKKHCVVCVRKDRPEHIVWVPGLRATEFAPVTRETETVLVLRRTQS